MAQDHIIVHGARVHNLKDLTVRIPRDRFVVITGLSGSGKSSLAFDTIYAEGQRRYVESLSAYARQFLGQMDKPDVDQIEGLSPAISIDQKGVSHNPRSTVGTVTEVYDYLRLLFARAGEPHCWSCGRPISQQTVSQMADHILARPPGTRFMILAPLVRDRKGHHQRVFDEVRRMGYVRVRVNGEIRDVSEEFQLDRYKMHTVEVVVDRLIVPGERRGEAFDSFLTRLADSLETALNLADGMVMVQMVEGEELLFSERFACLHCAVSVGEIEPRTFSFNSPHGACPTCQGLGTKMEVDPDLVVPNRDLSLAEGALAPWGRWSKGGTSDGYYHQLVNSVAGHFAFSMQAPWRELPQRAQQVLLHGAADAITVRYRNRQGRERAYQTSFEGIIPHLERRYRETSSGYIRGEIERFMAHRPCPECGGARLKKESLAVLIAGTNIHQVSRMSVAQALQWARQAPQRMSQRQRAIARQVLKEIGDRLSFLVDVGLDYLTLDRAATTLSGGEAQRIRLATQIGSQLMGVLYILDEPSIGLHQRDNARLIGTLQRMRNLGNTVIVVEHDEETIRSADWVIDLGPGAGEHGGRVVAEGPPHSIAETPGSITGDYLAGRRSIPVPARRRRGKGESLWVRGAAEHNLKEIDVELPLGRLVCITGVSGSGKSTLLVEILYARLAQILHQGRERPGRHRGLEGWEQIDKVINIDQAPIGRTPRSNPGTYTNVFTHIRELFAQLPDSRVRGYKPGRFSFNVKGGRCEACQGDGIIKIEMQFLPDVYVPCEVCRGQRYNRETLQVRYKGRNIHEVLEMSVEEGLRFFESIPAIKRKLKTLYDVGLGYVRLGQPAPTLSGGEAQRVKLARELSKRATGRTLYILDEPTTGLHFEDIKKLLRVLDRLVSGGNTVVVIEHNLDVIKCADWVIDLGPEGGEAGGRVVAQGTPEQVAAMEHSYTGQFLRKALDGYRVPAQGAAV